MFFVIWPVVVHMLVYVTVALPFGSSLVQMHQHRYNLASLINGSTILSVAALRAAVCDLAAVLLQLSCSAVQTIVRWCTLFVDDSKQRLLTFVSNAGKMTESVRLARWKLCSGCKPY